MASKCQRLVVIALVGLLFKCNSAETTELSNDPLSLVNPSVIVNIFNEILQLRGSSLEQINERLASARGDVEFVVNEINTQLNANILRIVGQVIRVNSENVKILLKDAIHVIVRNGFPDNPFMAAIVEATVLGQLEAQFQLINNAIESIAIPVNTGVVVSPDDEKSKRSLQPRALDLTTAVVDILGSLLQGRITDVIYDFFEIVKDLVSQFYITTPPADDVVGTILAYAQNVVLDYVIEFITNIQNSVVPTAESATDSAILASTVLI